MNPYLDAPVPAPAPRFEAWSTAKLAQMVGFARARVAEAQARFEAKCETERRQKRRTWESMDAEQYVRRSEDGLAMMLGELRRRALESVVERRVEPRRGPEARAGLDLEATA